MINSLRAKIVFLFVIGLSSILIITILLFSSEFKNRYKELFIERGNNAAKQLAFKTEQLLNLGLLPNEFSGYEKLCQNIIDDTEGIIYIGLLNSKDKEIFHAGKLNIDTSIYFKDNGYKNNKFIIYLPIKNKIASKNTILVLVDKNLVSQKTYDFVQSILLYSLLAIIMGVFGVLIYLRINLGSPFNSLVEHIQKTNINNSIDSDWELLKRKDELGIISRVFNDLMQRLSCSQKALEESNTELLMLTEQLEHRVQMRTKELSEVNKKLDSLAHMDILTGFSNRLHFEELIYQRFEHAKRNKHNFAILMIDLDGFKKINDNYGHSAGDFALKTIGQRIRTSFRDGDSVFRIGGDEFIIIVDEYKKLSDIIKISEKIKGMIVDPILYKEEYFCLGVSIGISCIENCITCNADELVSFADDAMYEAKRHGFSYVISDKKGSQVS